MSISSDSCDGFQELAKADDHEEAKLAEIISIHSSESSVKRKETKHVAVRPAQQKKQRWGHSCSGTRP